MAAITKRTVPFTGKLIVVDTPTAYKTVLSRLDAIIDRRGSQAILGKIASASSQQELQSIIDSVVKGNDFLFFNEFPFGPLLSLLQKSPHNTPQNPKITLYVIGNPLIAQQIIKRNPPAAVNIPPRLLLIEQPDKSGTQVLYHLPSSTMLFPADGSETTMKAASQNSNPELRTAVLGLDKKLDALVTYITRPASAEDGTKL